MYTSKPRPGFVTSESIFDRFSGGGLLVDVRFAHVWAIGLLFVVGLIVSGVAFTSRQRATEAALLRRQATVLQSFGRDLVAANNAKAIASITAPARAALFQVPAVVMLLTEGRVFPSIERVTSALAFRMPKAAGPKAAGQQCASCRP